MSPITCESSALMGFLGGNVEQTEPTQCTNVADLRVTAHDGSMGRQEMYCICQDCATHLLWLSHRPLGWIEDCQRIKKTTHHLQRSQPAPA